MKGKSNVGLIKFMWLVLFLLLQASPGWADPITVVIGKDLTLESGNTGELYINTWPGEFTRPTVLDHFTDGKQASAHVVATAINQGGGASATIGLRMSIQPGHDGRVSQEAEFTISMDYSFRVDVSATAFMGGYGAAWLELCYGGTSTEADRVEVIAPPSTPGHAEVTKNKIIKFKQVLSTTGNNTIQFFNIHADGLNYADVFASATVRQITIKFSPPKFYGLFIGIDYPSFKVGQMPVHCVTSAYQLMDNFRKLENTSFELLPGFYDLGGITTKYLEDKLNYFSAPGKMSPGDNFMFFFNGHGQKDPDVQRERLLIGKDENGAVWLYKDELAFYLKKFDDQGINVWVIIDACESGGFWDDALQYLKHIGFIASGWPGSKSVADENGGILTQYLANWLRMESITKYTVDTDCDGLIEFGELASKAESIGAFIQGLNGTQVWELGLGDPFIFSLDMWNPPIQKSPGFQGSFSGQRARGKFSPWLPLLLLD